MILFATIAIGLAYLTASLAFQQFLDLRKEISDTAANPKWVSPPARAIDLPPLSRPASSYTVSIANAVTPIKKSKP